MNKVILKVGGMTCSACSSGLEKYLNKQDGIKSASVNLVLSNALIEYYMNESIFEQVFKNINGLYIFGTLLFGIITALGLWIRNIKLLRSVEEVNNGKN